MSNPKGNRVRCKSCGRLAGKDGWCKTHRPNHAKPQDPNPRRENYMENPFIKDSFFSDRFEAISDTFPCMEE